MSGLTAWIGLAVIVIVLAAVNKWVKHNGKLGYAARRLKQLVDKQREGVSEPQDLPSWEECLLQLEAYPSNYNQLNQDIRFVERFAEYLAQHYPEDARLPGFQEAGKYRKDTIWGVKIQRRDDHT